MPATSEDRPFFIPSMTPGDAIARIYSLTGASASARGEKRAIVALRDALRLDIDIATTNRDAAMQIAEALDVEWRPEYATRTKVNIDGLNALLEGAYEAFRRGSARRLSENKPATLDAPRWNGFTAARSKIEAVNRISMLTDSGPEWLGPGSKEHKSVLIHLNDGLNLGLDHRLSKTKLSAAIAARLGAPWTDLCESTGETISLVGLNTILAGAELRLGRFQRGTMLFGTPEEEGRALAAALLDGFKVTKFPDESKRVHWDGRKCVEWLADNGTRKENMTEWPGWYWEFKGREILNGAFSPNPTPPTAKYGNTIFDYSLRYVWEMKAHTERWLDESVGSSQRGDKTSILNGVDAMHDCIDEHGLGLLIVGGNAFTDFDGSFKAWHDARKKKPSAPTNGDWKRRRKVAFEPVHVDAFWFDNLDALDAAKAAGQITGFNQPAQAPKKQGERGKPRKEKYSLHEKAVDGPNHVVRHDYPRTPPNA